MQIHLPYLPFKDFNSVTCIISASWEGWQAGKWGQCPKIRAVLRQTIESFPDFWAAGSWEAALQFFLLILKKGPFLPLVSVSVSPPNRKSLSRTYWFPAQTDDSSCHQGTAECRGTGSVKTLGLSLCQLPSRPSLLHNLGPETRTELWCNGSNCWPSGVSDF